MPITGEEKASVTAGHLVNRLFIHSDAVDRHLTAPLLLEREKHLAQLIEQCKSRKFVIGYASMLCHVVSHLDITPNEAVTEKEITTAASLWEKDKEVLRPFRLRERNRNFRFVARSFCQFLGRYQVCCDRMHPFEHHYAQFADALRHEHTYSAASIDSLTSVIRRFLVWFSQRQDSLSTVTLEDIDLYVAEQIAIGNSRRTIHGYCGALRTFFRYCEEQGWNQNKLSQTIRAPFPRKSDGSFKCPSWDEVRLVIAALDDASPSECRAKAVLLLASVYGLRRSEIVQLKLQDLDWHNEIITIRRAKNGLVQQMPIRYEVGEAIIRYLCNVRARARISNLFITLYPPYRPATSIAQAVYAILRRSGRFHFPWGMHALRHACATELLKKGTSLPRIADFLGHRDLRSVSIYAHCDLDALKRVADFRLTGVL